MYFRTCVEGMKVDDPDNVLYPPDRSCSTNVPFSDTPVQVHQHVYVCLCVVVSVFLVSISVQLWAISFWVK